MSSIQDQISLASSYQQPNIENALEKIRDLSKEAANATTSSENEVINNRIYFLFYLTAKDHQRSLPQNFQAPFFSFLKSCAEGHVKTYAEDGFRISARLMELSLCLMFKEMKLIDHGFDWSQYSSLEALYEHLGAIETNGAFSDELMRINIDPEVLIQNAHHLNLRNILEETLKGIIYFHRNIKGLEFHNKLNSLAEIILGNHEANNASKIAIEKSENFFSQDIDLFIQQAEIEKNFIKKKSRYQQIYARFQDIIKENQEKLPESLLMTFLSFLESCATCLYYAQIGSELEEGYRKSANLMEWSFLLQLNRMGLANIPLENLIFDKKLGEYDYLFEQINQIQIDSKILVQKAVEYGLRSSLEATLWRLSYSYQNITSLKDHECHKKIYSLDYSCYRI